MARSPEFNNEAVEGMDNLTVVQAVQAFREESEDARRVRMQLSKRNRDAARNVQNWDHKEAGQSSEFIPKTSSSLETFSSFIKKALLKFGHWFEAEASEESPIPGDAIRAIIMEFVNCLNTSPFTRNHTNIETVAADGIKVGLLEATTIFKVHGFKTKKPTFDFEKGESGWKIEPWGLAIDLVPPENYYPDPRGRGLYEIHRTERDLADVIRLAEQGVYDKEVVARLKADYAREELEYKEREQERHTSNVTPPTFRKRVVIDEFWGTILNSAGEVVHENVTCTVANDTYLIRKPIPNPFWHGESPFTVGVLTRVPFSVFHRALYDNAVPLNEAMNEIFNLMLDGGIASVWGVNQIRPGYLEDPRQVSNGIAQGTTLVLNDSAPPDAKVYEQVSTGEVPNDALAMFNVLDKEYNAAALTNEIKMGLIPTKDVKATEIVEASQSSAVTLDAMIGDYELALAKVLKKSWITIVQNMDDIDIRTIDNSAGRKAALVLARMSPEERFQAFGETCSFKVFGLSAILTRAQDFQKLIGLIQVIAGQPLLLQKFYEKYSEDKLIVQMMKMLNINPERFERSDEEKAQLQQGVDQASQLQQLGLSGSGSQGGSGTGGGAQTAQINQQITPSGGL